MLPMAKEKTREKPVPKAKQDAPALNPIYTIDTAAAMLEVTPRTLGDKFRGGEIRAYKRMGKWYTLHSDLVDYLKGA